MAKEMAPLIDAAVLSTDKIRKELISKPTYTKEEKELIYDVMLLVARYLHDAGVNCILDATFSSENSRKEAREKLCIAPSQVYLVECICPEDEVISRLKARKQDYSDADIAVYRNMKKVYEPVKDEHLVVDTSRPPEVNAREIKIRISAK